MASSAFNTSRRTLLGAIAAVPAIIVPAVATATPAAGQHAWYALFARFTAADAQFQRLEREFDPIAERWTAERPKEGAIPWQDLGHCDKHVLLFTADLDEYERAMRRARGVTWAGSDAVLARKVRAIQAIREHRAASARLDRRLNYTALAARYETASEARYELEMALVHMPAPDLRALHWKLKLVLIDEGDGYTPQMNMEWIRPILADVDRLLGGEKA